MATDDPAQIAQANGKIHYANCKRLIELIAKVSREYPGAPQPSAIPDLYAGELTVAGQDVVATLQKAQAFLSQPSIAPHYNPDYLNGLGQAVTAVGSDIAIAVQIGTGGPNPWNAPFAEVMTSASNWTNSYIDPYNIGYARISG